MIQHWHMHSIAHWRVLLCGLIILLGTAACSTVPSISKFPSPPRVMEGHFWVGELGPVALKEGASLQYPFVCTTDINGLGQPLIDNSEGIGNAVFPLVFGKINYFAKPDGYSQNCNIQTRVDYFYYSASARKFLPLANPKYVSAEVEKITVNGKQINFVVRVERGTINRFIYSIAMLAPYPESLASPQALDNSAWNGKLVYKFTGGIGLGHWQGRLKLGSDQALHYESLKRGYAVASSTGNNTATHYNLTLAAETAAMVKQHFAAIYGRPEHTIGVGGSGGAIQQYVIGQNRPGLIDAAIPQLSFPDMITQTIYVADCELLERYFDDAYQSDPNSKWNDWRLRAKVSGLNANTTARQSSRIDNPFAPLPGASTCSYSWRGEVPKMFNPHWAPQEYFDALRRYRYPESVIADVKWTHWNDLSPIYPQDELGFAPNSWDNVGVQYGLVALTAGDISVAEFLELNACVGGWKPPQEMTRGNYPWNKKAGHATTDPWDQANMDLNPACATGNPAPRTAGSVAAMRAAYESGQIFSGKLDIPVIDVRWYLDTVLDMHHSLGSFSARARIRERQGQADNQVIWVAECSETDPYELSRRCNYDPTGDALDVIEQWLTAIKRNAEKSVALNKPAAAVDTCFDADGSVIYAGAAAWDGVLENKPAGSCHQRFPVYPTSRMIAGESIAGYRFKCALKSVDIALTDGTYGAVNFSDEQGQRLKEIFPAGICDYSRPDMGR